MTRQNDWMAPEVNPDEFSPAVWAYIGDAVYELFTRSQLLKDGPAKTKQLHKATIARVKASFQAELLKRLEPDLTTDELEVVKKGRNIKSGHIPAYTDMITYRYSTAFEALIGYLYLTGSYQRLQVILAKTLMKESETTGISG